MFERLVSGGEDDGGRSVPAVSDPGFGPVQDPLVSFLTGCCRGGTCVAAVTCGTTRRIDPFFFPPTCKLRDARVLVVQQVHGQPP